MTTADVVERATPAPELGSRPPASGPEQAAPRPEGRDTRARARRALAFRRIRRTGWVAFGLWCVALLVFSVAVYRRFHLAQDFGLYSQAWTLIGTGHLDPNNSIYGYPFYTGNFELVLWPLALLHVVFPQPVVLLFVQDAAIAGSGLVAYLWVADVLEVSAAPVWVAGAVAGAVALVTLGNPASYLTAGFDVHLEPLATVLLLLAGRDFWRARFRRAWIFAGLVLLCGAFATVALMGLGLAAVLAVRKTRRHGLLLVAVGLGWSLVISVLHANHGDLSGYTYLSRGGNVLGMGGLVAVAGGMAVHPTRVLHQIHARLGDIWALLRPVGIVGLASAWGFGVPAVVLFTDTLHDHRAYIQQPFQNFAVFPFVTVGTVMVLVWVATHVGKGSLLAGAVGAVVLAVALTYGVTRAPHDVHWLLDQRVGSSQAAELDAALARIAPDAEVIATRAVVGRFCERPSCYIFVPYVAQHVDNRDVVFVFAADSQSGLPPALARKSIDYLHDYWRARIIVDDHGVTALRWKPPPNVHFVTVPLPVPASQSGGR